MAAKDMSDMDISYPHFSNVLMNDSKELRKKQPRNCVGKYNRRLFSKLNNSSPIPNKRSKPAFYKRYQRTKKGTLSQKMTPKKPKTNIGGEWKKEYDIWNMIVQTLDEGLLKNHKVNWAEKVIGIRDFNHKIRLIQNREELQQQILVASTGTKSQLKDLLNANDSTADFALKFKFKLVPVVESLTIVNKSTEKSFVFADNNDINNNDIQCENMVIENEAIENKLDEDRTLVNSVNNHESTANIICDKTMVNTTCSTWEYSDFCGDIVPAASSTFIENDEKENHPILLHEKENTPYLFAPKR